MSEKTLFIIGQESAARARLERVLSEHGWRCLMARSFSEAHTFDNSESVLVLFVSADLLLSGDYLNWKMIIGGSSQIVAYSDQEASRFAELEKLKFVVSFVHLSSSMDWQVVRSAKVAFDLSAVDPQRQSTGVDGLHRDLFRTSVALQSVESQKELLDRICREVAQKAGFARALIVLGDDKYRIQSSHAFLTDERRTFSLSHLIGQPLMPILPNAPLLALGHGFAQVDEQAAQGQAQRHLILPLTKADGAVFGFLTLDSPQSASADLSALSEPVSLLLSLTASFIEVQTLRAGLKERQGSAAAATVERSAELRQAQERFNRLVNLTDDIVYLTDSSGRIIYLNNAFTERLGFARENYIGKMLDAVLEDLAAENELSQATLTSLQDREEQSTTGEIELFSKTGYRAIFSVVHQWIKQGDDVVAGQGLLRDLTEQRELRAQLARSERLGMAGRLASGMAHEINNPLQAMSSHLAGVRGRVGEDPIAIESFNVVADSIERIRLIVRSLLDLQRTEHSVKKVDDLNAVVEKALLLLAPQLRTAEIKVTAKLAPELPPVRMNSGEIQQVIINLVLNAVAAMPGGGELTLASERAEDEIHVKVKDTGSGMTAEVLEKLFLPFSTHREHGGGLGLGLFLSKNIIREHGGEISATSHLGKGSEFLIKLPLGNKKTAP